MPKLVVIRGLPGSGKSTLAAAMAGFVHVEADMFFQTPEGYKFEASKLGQAHDWCHKTAALALERGDNVVVANTFSRRWEIVPYCTMAQKLNCEFEVIEAKGEYQNVHNVPQSTVDKMKARWETWA